MATYTELSLWDQVVDKTKADYRTKESESCLMCQYKQIKVNGMLKMKDWCRELEKEVDINHVCNFYKEFRR